MTAPLTSAVVVDTMVASSIVNAARVSALAESYRSLIAGRPVVISFATVTEMRFGALKANWGEFRRRALDRDLAKLTIAQPDDDLMRECAELRARCEKAGHGLGQKVHEADRWIARHRDHARRRARVRRCRLPGRARTSRPVTTDLILSWLRQPIEQRQQPATPGSKE